MDQANNGAVPMLEMHGLETIAVGMGQAKDRRGRANGTA
jgi:hypothetical protein